jgi:hypothetical protein
MSESHASEQHAQLSRKEIILAVSVQLLFTVGSFVLLKRTPDSRLRGPRWMWRVIIPASVTRIRGSEVVLAPIGPVLFLVFGRRRAR